MKTVTAVAESSHYGSQMDGVHRDIGGDTEFALLGNSIKEIRVNVRSKRQP